MFLWVSFWREIRKQLFHRNKDFILDHTVNRELYKNKSNMSPTLYFHLKTSDFHLSLRWGRCRLDILLLGRTLSTGHWMCILHKPFQWSGHILDVKKNDEQRWFWPTFLRVCVDGVLLCFGFLRALKISYYIQRGLDNATIQVHLLLGKKRSCICAVAKGSSFP